jgi:hypothetical protein
MSYENVREHLTLYKQAVKEGNQDFESLAEALEHLTLAIETDMTQLKIAMGHVARLLEESRSSIMSNDET